MRRRAKQFVLVRCVRVWFGFAALRGIISPIINAAYIASLTTLWENILMGGGVVEVPFFLTY